MVRKQSQRRRRQAVQPAINTKTCSLQLDRSLCTAGETCVLEPSLSFAGPREYRWQGLDVPAMMGKRRGTAQIAAASLGVCATSYRHKNLLFSQLDRSLCTSRRNMIVKPSLSFAGPREYRGQGLEVPAMMGKRRGAAQIITAPPAGCAASNRHKNLLFSQLARSLCTAGET